MRILVPLLLIANVASADEPPAITADDLVIRVARGAPRRDLLGATTETARAEAKAAALLGNPTFSYDREEVFPEGGGVAEQVLRLSVPVDLSGRRGKRVDAARAGVRIAEAEEEAAALDLVLDALDAYHDAAFAQARVAALRDGRDALAAAVEAMRKRAVAGDAAGYDADRLALELAAFDDVLASAELERDAAQRALAALAGAEDRLAAADPLALPVRPPDLGELRPRRAEARAARLRIEQAETARSAAARAWIPTLILGGGLKTADDALGYVAGVALDVPLFDRGQDDAARAEAQRIIAVTQLRVVEHEAAAATRAAHAALVARIEQARAHASRQAPLAAELVRRAEVAYAEGERPIVELVDAHRTARDVAVRGLELTREALRAETSLWRALGVMP